jgi:hypothetical protein
MNRTLSLWMLLLLALWGITFVFKFAWLQNYVDDFLFIPIVAGLALLIQQYFTPFFQYPLSTVFILWVYTCLVFEGMFPFILSSYTFDWLDMPVYGFGAAFFHLFMNRPINHRKTSH